MKIGIDVSRLAFTRTGVGNYVYHLIHHLARLDGHNEYFLYPRFWSCYPKRFPIAELPSNLNFKVWNFEKRSNLFGCFLFGNKTSMAGEVDVVHSTNIVAPCLKNSKLIVTLHDLTYHVYPKWHTVRNVLFSRYYTKRAVQRAYKIIVDSESTKKDLLAYYKIEESKIKVIYLAAAPYFYPEQDPSVIQTMRESLGTMGDFILYVGTLEPRKNLEALLCAYARLVSENKEIFPLVISGTPGWKYSSLFKLVHKLNLSQKIKFLGYVSNDALRVLYSTASIFVYPSLYEGFGLPVVEAMACGAPVITSGVSSLPEVSGDAALLIDPKKTDEIYEALKRLFENENLRNQLRVKSLKQSQKFSWFKTAQETLALYQECM
ncbi:MAG: glycosyltransferase family 4 protein [Deltaproteobacteria bacterium]|nr:glycosyltransferase family 4 protein [Deltaproteobacteria bacterium]